MSIKNWFNKLKPSEDIRARLRERLANGLAWTKQKMPRDQLANAWKKISTSAMKSDSIRSLLEKSKNSFGGAWSRFKASLPETFPRSLDDLRNLHPQELADGLSQTIAKGNTATWLRLGAVGIASYFLADTTALITGSLIPEPPVVPPITLRPKALPTDPMTIYSAIISRNIFNSKGIIPDDIFKADPNGPARRSNLPLNLIGTVVLLDERKSIAAIEDKSTNKILPVRLNETIEGKATIKKIEHLKVTFINNQSGVLEYIEIPEEILNRVSAAKPSGVSKGGPIERVGETHFNVQKAELDKALGNLNQILTQAKAIPNFENGVPNGYKIINIVPNSIYTKLGIKEGDVLMAVNGEPINDPGKAFQLMNELRSGAGQLEVTLKSPDGKVRTQSYEVQ
jgi:general secretion pathway protein C